MTTAITAPDTADLPAVPGGPGSDITLADIEMPKITLLQSLSPLLQDNEELRTGQVIWHTDGMGIHYLIGGPDKADSFTAYVVHRAKAVAEFDESGAMTFLPPGSAVDRNATPPQWDVWFYHLVIPEVSQVFPAKLMLTKSGLRAARTINTALASADMGPNGVAEPVAIKFRTVDATGGKNGQHRYKRFSTGPGTMDPDGFDTAVRIQAGVLAMEREARTSNQGPSVDDLPEM